MTDEDFYRAELNEIDEGLDRAIRHAEDPEHRVLILECARAVTALRNDLD